MSAADAVASALPVSPDAWNVVGGEGLEPPTSSV
jgi:hypothetical protein